MCGVKIDKVIEGSIAHHSGICSGDIVLEIYNVKVKSPLQMFAVMYEQRVHGKVEIKLMREGVEMSLTLTLP
jgi:S1-C subfamily serine protease